MNRYEKIFKKLEKEKKIAFMPFWMIGDPDIEESLKILRIFAKNSDILEIGFPFSDPLADGPTIQESVNNALKSGTNTKKCFEIIKTLRKENPQKPIGLLVYFNLILAFGVDEFFEELEKSGVDSVIIPELPPEEVNSKIESKLSIGELAKKHSVSLVFLPSTNTTDKRLEEIISLSSSFIYAISSPSTTGGKIDFSEGVGKLIQKIKSKTQIPVCVGFGVSSPEDIRELKKLRASGAIIASKLIKIYRKDGIEKMEDFLKKCKKVTR